MLKELYSTFKKFSDNIIFNRAIHSSCWDFNQFYRKLVCEVSSAVPESDDTQMEMEIEGQRNEDSNDIKQFKVGSF